MKKVNDTKRKVFFSDLLTWVKKNLLKQQIEDIKYEDRMKNRWLSLQTKYSNVILYLKKQWKNWRPKDEPTYIWYQCYPYVWIKYNNKPVSKIRYFFRIIKKFFGFYIVPRPQVERIYQTRWWWSWLYWLKKWFAWINWYEAWYVVKQIQRRNRKIEWKKKIKHSISKIFLSRYNYIYNLIINITQLQGIFWFRFTPKYFTLYWIKTKFYWKTKYDNLKPYGFRLKCKLKIKKIWFFSFFKRLTCYIYPKYIALYIKTFFFARKYNKKEVYYLFIWYIERLTIYIFQYIINMVYKNYIWKKQVFSKLYEKTKTKNKKVYRKHKQWLASFYEKQYQIKIRRRVFWLSFITIIKRYLFLLIILMICQIFIEWNVFLIWQEAFYSIDYIQIFHDLLQIESFSEFIYFISLKFGYFFEGFSFCFDFQMRHFVFDTLIPAIKLTIVSIPILYYKYIIPSLIFIMNTSFNFFYTLFITTIKNKWLILLFLIVVLFCLKFNILSKITQKLTKKKYCYVKKGKYIIKKQLKKEYREKSKLRWDPLDPYNTDFDQTAAKKKSKTIVAMHKSDNNTAISDQNSTIILESRNDTDVDDSDLIAPIYDEYSPEPNDSLEVSGIYTKNSYDNIRDLLEQDLNYLHTLTPEDLKQKDNDHKSYQQRYLTSRHKNPDKKWRYERRAYLHRLKQKYILKLLYMKNNTKYSIYYKYNFFRSRNYVYFFKSLARQIPYLIFSAILSISIFFIILNFIFILNITVYLKIKLFLTFLLF